MQRGLDYFQPISCDTDPGPAEQISHNTSLLAELSVRQHDVTSASSSSSSRHWCLKEFFFSYPYKKMFPAHNSGEEQSVAALIVLRIHKAPEASSQQQPTAD